MKYRIDKKINILAAAGGFALLAGLLFMYNFQQNGGDASMVIGLILIAAGAVALIVYFVFLAQVLKALGRVRKRQKAATVNPYIDYANSLDEIRRNYKSDAGRAKNVVKTHKDRVPRALHALMDYSVCNGGEVYYAGLVMANEALFGAKGLVALAPALILFSTDSYFDENPRKLEELAKKLFDMREQLNADGNPDNVPENLRGIVTDMTDERLYKYNQLLPVDFCDGRQIYLTTVLIHKGQFPSYCITDQIFPIVASPSTHKNAFAVDFIYWSDDFAAEFLNHVRLAAEAEFLNRVRLAGESISDGEPPENGIN
jgi:hypothetical protein